MFTGLTLLAWILGLAFLYGCVRFAVFLHSAPTDAEIGRAPVCTPDTNVLHVPPTSFPTRRCSDLDLSIEKVRQHIERGELVPSDVDSKPLIMREEGERWLRTRPAERPEKVA